MGENYSKYDLDDEEILVSDSRVFKETGEYHEVEDIETNERNRYYLHEDQVVLFLEGDQQAYKSLRYKVVGKNYDKTLTSTAYDMVKKKDLDEVHLLERVTPEKNYECPECGAIAGNKDKHDHPRCIDCGYGID